jgi:hypothetical protein
MMRNAGILVLVALCLTAAAAAPAAARSKTTSFGVKGILLMPGEAYVEEARAPISPGIPVAFGGRKDAAICGATLSADTSCSTSSAACRSRGS